MKFIKKLLAFSSLFAMVGCSSPVTSHTSITNSSIDSELSSAPISSSSESLAPSSIVSNSSRPSRNRSSSSKVSSSSNKPVDIVVKPGEIYEGSDWYSEVIKVLEYTVGDYAKHIPGIETDYYTATVAEYDDTDIQGNAIKTNIATIQCAPLPKGFDLEEYENALLEFGFIYSYNYECYMTKASDVDNIYLDASIARIAHTTIDALQIQLYRKTMRYKEWISGAANEIIGKDVPFKKANSYEYYFDAYTLGLTIYFNGFTDTDVVAYQALLTKDGWVKKATDIYSDRYDSTDGWLHVTIASGFDAFGETYMSLTVTNDWPLFLIKGALGFDIPKLEKEGAVYESYTTNMDSQGDYYTDIGYSNVELLDYEVYVQQLLALGFNYIDLGPDRSNPSVSKGSNNEDIYSSYLYKTNSKGETNDLYVFYSPSHPVQLLIIIYDAQGGN